MSMKTLQTLLSEIHARTLLDRRLTTILKSDAFMFLWELSNDAEQDKVQGRIRLCDVHWIRQWIHAHPSQDVGELSYTVLRDRAKDMRIQRWSRLSKLELISAIRSKLDDKNTNGPGNS